MAALHSPEIAGFLGALAAGHAAVAAYSLLAWGRASAVVPPRPGPTSGRSSRPETLSTGGSPRSSAVPGRPAAEREILLFGLLNLAVVAVDGGLAVALAFAARGAPFGPPLLAAQIGRVLAIAFLLHFVLDYARVTRSPWAVPAIYGVAGGLGLASVASPGPLDEGHLETARMLGLELPSIQATPTVTCVLISATTLTVAAFALLILRGAFLRGRREAPGLIGLGLLMLALGWDALRALGWAVGPPLAPLGFAALVNGVVMTILSRFTALRGQLEGRARQLKDRARDLSRAYAELRAAQDELVKKEQLAAVGELSAVVAHEVRNPLAIISNAVATLRRSGIGEADRETLLTILDEESSRLNRLVSDLLRYARPITLERQLVGVRELVEKGMALAEGKLHLEAELVEPAPTARIWGDPNLLRQVFDNLIANAIQAMESGGVLTVTLAEAELDGVAGVEIQIQDTGEGMDTQVRARALDPFFTTRPSGTGLGLAIVARIVDAHGGVLRIKSKAGAGTVMHVFLPRGSSGDRPARLPPRSSDPGPASEPPLPPDIQQSLEGARRPGRFPKVP